MFRSLASGNGVLLAVFVAALVPPFQRVSTRMISSSDSTFRNSADQLEVTKKEETQLEDSTRLLHDQQMARWDPTKMAAGESDWPCPDAASIAPCTCHDSSSPNYNLDIDCSTVTGDTEIIEAFGTLFPFDDIGQFLIEGTSEAKVPITNFTQNMFGVKSFSNVKVVYTTLERIEDSVFQQSHDTLTSLALEKNDIQLFPFEILPEYKILTFIHLPSNNILELPKIESSSLTDINMNHNKGLILVDDQFTFVGAQKLRWVGLTDTNITKIPPNLFRDLPSITTIKMSSNNIPELAAAAINADGNTIKDLDLSNNFLSTVRVGAITGMHEDGTIDLSNNGITLLEEEVWGPILQQLTLDGSLILDGNSLTCGCDMNWIITSPDTHLKKLSAGTTCYTQDSVHDLDVEFFTTNCEQPGTNLRPLKQ